MNTKVIYFKGDVREPYMGNTLVIGVRIRVTRISENLTSTKVSIHNMQETGGQDLHPIPEEEWDKLFNH
jgi:hypothetical protein